MKKLVTLGLSTLMVASVLTGCGGSKEAPKTPSDKKLQIAGLDGGYGKAGWEAVAKAFTEKTGVEVELTLEKNIAEVLRPKIQAGTEVPDLIYLSVGSEGGLTDTMIKEKTLLDISDVLDQKVLGEEKTVKEKLIPGIADGLATKPYGDGKLYLAPLNYGPCGLFYNAGLFEEKGWSVPTTWDEMWELGDKAKAEGISLFTYPTTGYFDAFFSALLNETAGPDVYTKLMSYDPEAWKDANVKKAFEIVGKLAEYTEPTTVANANKDNFTKNQQLILDNKALFVPNGTWLPNEMKDAPRADGFKWGFTALPKASADGDAYSTTFSEQMFIPAAAGDADLAKQFIEFAYSDEAVKLFYENGGAVMPIQGAVDMMGDDDDNKLYYSVYETGAKANAVGFKAMDNMPEGVNVSDANSGILYATVNSIVTGDKTVDDWYNAVVEAVQQVADANK